MADLSGRNALVVEDEAGIAILIEDMLQDLGCEVVASASRLKRASEIACTVTIDFAILDVNLDGEPAFPVARILRERKVPFLFSTGYGLSGIPSEFDGCPLLSKPFLIEELQRELLTMLAGDSPDA
jgi:DNA-binding response OmpR family regulator